MSGSSPLDMIAELERVARRRRPLLVVGLLAIVVALVTFTIYTNMLLKDERVLRQHWQTEANHNADLIFNARQALQEGKMAQLNKILIITEKRVEQQAQNAVSSAAPGQPVPVPSPGVAPIPLPASTAGPVAPLDLPKPGKAWEQLVFLQFAGTIRREQMVALNLGLREKGWKAQGPSGERTGAAIGYNEVRFATDDDREAAENLAAVVNTTKIGGRPLVATRNRLIQPGTLEIWLSN